MVQTSIQIPTSRRIARVLRAIAIACASVCCAWALSPVVGATELTDDAGLRDFVGSRLGAMPGRVAIEVGALDARLKLRPCGRIEPFVPSGARLWGRTHIGMRCQEPGGWTVYLPVNVRVFASVPVAARTLPAGTTLVAADLAMEEREISLAGVGPAPALERVEGRVLARGFAAGQAIDAAAFRSQPVIANGDTVKVVVHGEGFAVTATGIALAQADDGQPIRVKLESGQTVQGTARPDKIVEMRI